VSQIRKVTSVPGDTAYFPRVAANPCGQFWSGWRRRSQVKLYPFPPTQVEVPVFSRVTLNEKILPAGTVGGTERATRCAPSIWAMTTGWVGVGLALVAVAEVAGTTPPPSPDLPCRVVPVNGPDRLPPKGQNPGPPGTAVTITSMATSSITAVTKVSSERRRAERPVLGVEAAGTVAGLTAATAARVAIELVAAMVLSSPASAS
jgi:hypothetical protein